MPRSRMRLADRGGASVSAQAKRPVFGAEPLTPKVNETPEPIHPDGARFRCPKDGTEMGVQARTLRPEYRCPKCKIPMTRIN